MKFLLWSTQLLANNLPLVRVEIYLPVGLKEDFDRKNQSIPILAVFLVSNHQDLVLTINQEALFLLSRSHLNPTWLLDFQIASVQVLFALLINKNNSAQLIASTFGTVELENSLFQCGRPPLNVLDAPSMTMIKKAWMSLWPVSKIFLLPVQLKHKHFMDDYSWKMGKLNMQKYCFSTFCMPRKHQKMPIFAVRLRICLLLCTTVMDNKS